MDGFGGDNFDQADVDPAAEFLAREKDQLAGLVDDVIPSAAGDGTGDDAAANSGEHIDPMLFSGRKTIHTFSKICSILRSFKFLAAHHLNAHFIPLKMMESIVA